MSFTRYTLFATYCAVCTFGAQVPEAANNQSRVGWVPEPRSRGTFGLITSCVVTLGLCVWTAVHPDVLPNSTPWQRAWDKVLWMLMALCTPDVVVLHAYKQWRDVRRIHRIWCDDVRMKTDIGKEGTFFAVMRGFVSLEGESLPPTEVVVEALSSFQERHPESPITRKDIVDKGKASIIAKCLVCAQVSWLMIQLIARKASGLPISLIELHVVIHILIAAVLYGFWWNKPMDVGEPIKLGSSFKREYSDEDSTVNALLDYKKTFEMLHYDWWNDSGNYYGAIHYLDRSEDMAESIGPLIFYLIYAGLHATAWNAQFPSPIERWVWRGSCIIIGTAPLGLSLLVSIEDSISSRKATVVVVVTQQLLKVVYLVATAALFVESFLCLRSVPSSVYETVAWANYIPHI